MRHTKNLLRLAPFIALFLASPASAQIGLRTVVGVGSFADGQHDENNSYLLLRGGLEVHATKIPAYVRIAAAREWYHEGCVVLDAPTPSKCDDLAPVTVLSAGLFLKAATPHFEAEGGIGIDHQRRPYFENGWFWTLNAGPRFGVHSVKIEFSRYNDFYRINPGSPKFETRSHSWEITWTYSIL